tara:strand:- start:79744 stop:80607 length:864 start_codon:yes stop_codon:yes gene_type:complete
MVRFGNQIGGLGSAAFVVVSMIAGACGSDPKGTLDAGVGAYDAPPQFDAGGTGVDGGRDLADGGASLSDAGATSPDGGASFPDAGAGSPDAGLSVPDAGSPDAGTPDAGTPDAGTPDAGTPDAGGGITTACTFGTGQALWRLTFPANMGGYATVEEWDNGCDYSLADQACSLSGEPHNYANFGPGILFNSSADYFRVRFSAAGLSFTQATLYITAHADGSGIPNAVLESPIYGSLAFAPTVPISTHRTYAVDWSDFLSPNDSPSLTAVTLRSNPTGLAVSEIQLCVE